MAGVLQEELGAAGVVAGNYSPPPGLPQKEMSCQFEHGLPIPFPELIENHAPRVSCERVADVGHGGK
jgi:hypothetical protein